jgi:hypothetical protein
MPLLILDFFKKIFGSWQVMLIIILALAGAFGYYKYHSMETNLAKTEQNLKVSEANNAVLQNNVTVLQQTNAQNGVIIGQLTADKDRDATALAALTTKVATTNKALDVAKAKNAASKDAVVPLSNRLKDAITAVQQQRAAQ